MHNEALDYCKKVAASLPQYFDSGNVLIVGSKEMNGGKLDGAVRRPRPQCSGPRTAPGEAGWLTREVVVAMVHCNRLGIGAPTAMLNVVSSLASHVHW